MKKFDDEELFEIQKEYEQMMKEMEEDEKFEDYTVPEEWDREFRAIIEKTLQSEKHKKRKKIIQKALSIAAGVILVLGIGTLSITENVQGVGIKELFQSMFHIGRDTYIINSPDSDIEFEDSDMREIIFEGDSLNDVMEEARNELKRPMFYFEDIFGEYTIQEAKYYKDFYIFSIELKISNEIVYITQESVYDVSGTGDIAEKEECYHIYNEHLGQDINIYASQEEDGYWFNVEENGIFFSFIGNVSLEKCKNLAKSLYFQ